METKNLAAWQERHGVQSLLDAVDAAVKQERRGLWCPRCWEQFSELFGVLTFAGAYGLCPGCVEWTGAVPDGWVWTSRRIED